MLTEADHESFSKEPPTDPPSTREFEAEGRLQAVDFKRHDRWRVTTPDAPRGLTVEVLDHEFLRDIADGKAVSSEDIFRFKIRETVDPSKKTRQRTWQILKVISHRRGVHDDDDTAGGSASKE